MISNYSAGRYASDADAVCRSSAARTGQRAALVLNGRNGSAATSIAAPTVLPALVDRGFIAMVADWSSVTHWANATALARLVTAKPYVQGPPWRAAPGPLGLAGGSMGSLLAILFALANPSSVFAVALSLPIVNFLAFYGENRGGFAAEIAAARGGAPIAADDPLTRAAEYGALGIPTRLWASSDDALCPLAEAEEFAELAGADVVNMGALGHALSATYPAEAATFLAEHAPAV